MEELDEITKPMKLGFHPTNSEAEDIRREWCGVNAKTSSKVAWNMDQDVKRFYLMCMA